MNHARSSTFLNLSERACKILGVESFLHNQGEPLTKWLSVHEKHMEDPIVIPTAKSVQKTLQKNSIKGEQAPTTKALVISEGASAGSGSPNTGLSARLATEVLEELAVWQSDRSRQSNLLKSLEVG